VATLRPVRPRTPPRWALRAAPLLIALVAFALRARALRGQNLGFDGGLAVALAASPLSELLDLSARDVHPPLYYLALGGWWRLVGPGVAPALWPSLALGVVSVCLMWRLSRPAAVLLALSPLHVYDGMAARDFGALVALTLAATVALMRGKWAALALLYAVGLLTSYFFLLTVVAHGVWTLWRWGALRRWAAAAGPGMVLIALWAGLSAVRIGAAVASGARPTQTESPGLAPVVSGLLQTVVGGSVLGDSTGAAGAWAIVAAWGAALAFAPFVRRRTTLPEPTTAARHRWLIGVLGFELALVGTALVVALWLRDVAPARYALVILPWAAMLTGLGMATAIGASRFLGPFYGLFVLSPLLLGLWAGWRPVELPKAFWDPSGMAAWLDRTSLAGDQVVFISLEQAGYYEALSDAHLPWRVIPVGPRYLEGNLEAEAADKLDPLVSRIVGSPRRVQLVLYQGGIAPEHHVLRNRLATTAFPAAETALADSQVLTYVVPEPGERMLPVGARYEGAAIESLVLHGMARRGAGFGLTLNWRAEGPTAKPYSVFVHLFDGRGEKVAQHDATPADGVRPTDQWRPGELIADRHGLRVPPVSDGPFSVLVGLYDASGARLPLVGGGDSIRIGLD
jgi:hypothetical protein